MKKKRKTQLMQVGKNSQSTNTRNESERMRKATREVKARKKEEVRVANNVKACSAQDRDGKEPGEDGKEEEEVLERKERKRENKKRVKSIIRCGGKTVQE